MMKTKRMWFLLSTALLLAVTIIALGLPTGDFFPERNTQMDPQNLWTPNSESSQVRPAQPDNGELARNLRAGSAAPARTRSVIINRTPLSDDQIRALEQQSHAQIPAGSYWYDKRSGAWGLEGGPTSGFTFPGLSLGGPLYAATSRGNTGVFINGRELPDLDVLGLQQLVGPVLPGRYWVDAQGYCGYEGGPARLNLVRLAQVANHHQGGKGITSGMYNSGIGSVNGGGFISGSSSATR
jgi:hypothetical protein